MNPFSTYQRLLEVWSCAVRAPGSPPVSGEYGRTQCIYLDGIMRNAEPARQAELLLELESDRSVVAPTDECWLSLNVSARNSTQ